MGTFLFEQTMARSLITDIAATIKESRREVIGAIEKARPSLANDTQACIDIAVKIKESQREVLGAIKNVRPSIANDTQGGSEDRFIEALSSINKRMDKQEETMKEMLKSVNNRRLSVFDDAEQASWTEVVKQTKRNRTKDAVAVPTTETPKQQKSATRHRPPAIIVDVNREFPCANKENPSERQPRRPGGKSKRNSQEIGQRFVSNITFSCS